MKLATKILLCLLSSFLLIQFVHTKSNGEAQIHCLRIRQHANLSGDLCHGFHNRYHIDLGSGGVQRYGQELVNYFNSQGKKHIPAMEVGNTMIRKARALMRENNEYESDGHVNHHFKDCIRKNSDTLKRNTKCLRSNVKSLRRYADQQSRSPSHRHHKKKKSKKSSTKKSNKKKPKYDQQLEDEDKQDAEKTKSSKHRRRKPKNKDKERKEEQDEQERKNAEKEEEERKLKEAEETKRKEEEAKKAAAKPEFDFTNKNHYEILGVPTKEANADKIKEGFNTMNEKTDPNKHPGDDYVKWNKQVKEAFEVLKDAKRKADYDLTLK